MLKTHVRRKDKGLIAGAAGFALIVGIVGWWLIGEIALIICLALCTMLILGVCLEIYRRLTQQIQADYRQVESLFSIFSVIKANVPLPDTRGWASSPDLLKTISEIVISKSPQLVVEASSGVSTLIIAYCLKQTGKGEVISLEHDPEYAAANQSLILAHGLNDIATIAHAPLKEVEINNAKWLWYDLDRLKTEQPIDLLVIDGPPGVTQDLARYPALPLLYKRLADESTVILDDGNRKDEKEIVKRWKKEFNDIDYRFLQLEKGGFIINKRVKTENT